MKYRNTGILLGADKFEFHSHNSCDEYRFERNIGKDFCFMMNNCKEVLSGGNAYCQVINCMVSVVESSETSVLIYNLNEFERKRTAEFLDDLVRENSDG